MLRIWLLVFCATVTTACSQNTDATSSAKNSLPEQNSNPKIIVQFSTPTPIAISTQVLPSTSTQPPNIPTPVTVLPSPTTTPVTVLPSQTTTPIPKKEIIFSKSPYSQAVVDYLNIAPQLRLGDPDAPIYLWIHEDFRCPYCKKFADETVQNLIENYVESGILQIIFVNTPIFGGSSDRAANASLCAAQQDKFWEYKDALYAVQNKKNAYTEKNLLKYFSNLPNSTFESTQMFDQCLLDTDGNSENANGAYIQNILNEGESLETILGLPIRGVPWSFLVIGKYYEFDIEKQRDVVRNTRLATFLSGAHPYENFVELITILQVYINHPDY